MPAEHLVSPTVGRNRILDALSADTRTRLLGVAELVPLKLRQVMFDIDQPIEYVYFPVHGVVSIVSTTLAGEAIETATVGSEGMTGVPLLLGATQMSAQAFCQVAGRAYRIAAADFCAQLDSGSELRPAVARYALAFLTQTAQTSACNRLHTMRQRCVRWLLETHDRVAGETFNLTHEFLAQMMGVRRATVSEVASALQRDGLIDYSYRQITVRDRAGLESEACDCYRIIRCEYERLIDGKQVPSLFAGVTTAETGDTALQAPTSTADSPASA